MLSQTLGLRALVLALLPFLLAGQLMRKRWWGLVRRAKMLLLVLALVISYSVPGLLWAGYEWAPSQEGLLAAGEQVLRLLLLFAALAALLERLPREDLLVALWSLLRVLIPRAWADHSVARLALVLKYVEDEPRGRSWRHLVFDSSVEASTPEIMTLAIPIWRRRDIALIVLLCLIPLAGRVLA